MKWLSRLRCELQDHIRVTEAPFRDDYQPILFGMNGKRRDDYQPTRYSTVTRCTRCGWTSRRMDG